MFFAAKPGHVGLMAFAGLFGGLQAWKALLLMAILSVGILVLLQSVAEQWFGKEWGLLTGLATACSPLLVEYSKTALSPVSSLFFAVLSLWFLQQGKRPLLMHICAGLAAAAAVLCHYNTLPLLFAIMVSHIHRCRPKDIAAALLGGLFFLLLAEGVLTVADRILAGVYPEFKTFFGELFYNLNRNHLSGKVFNQFDADALVTDGFRGYTVQAYHHTAGWLLAGFSAPLICFAVGFTTKAILKRPFPLQSAEKTRETLYIMGWLILFPMVAWLLYPWKIERNFVQCIPGIVLLFPPLFCVLWGNNLHKKQYRLAVILAALTLCLAGILVNFPKRTNSPIVQMIELNRSFLESLPADSANANSFPRATSPLWKWYLGPEQANTGRAFRFLDFSSFSENPLLITTDYSLRSTPENYEPWGKPLLDQEHKVPWRLLIRSTPEPEQN